MSLSPMEKEKPEPLFLSALKGSATKNIPFWLMRQAGRYLPEYRALREKAGSFLNLCFTPDHATEVTLQPLRRFDMDAAILFSDILVTPYALGQELSFVEGEGPRLPPLKCEKEIDALNFNAFDQKLAPVYQAIKNIRAGLPDDKALIGFAGAPWTLACYMVQGQGDGEFAAARKLALLNPSLFEKLIDLLTKATIRYLSEQIRSGVDTVQIFDSWAGLLPPSEFARWVVTPTAEIVAALKKTFPQTPIIGFPRGAGVLYAGYTEQIRADGIGLDTQTPVSYAVKTFAPHICLQGNLDPLVLLAGGQSLKEHTERILHDAANHPFIFNLGHGIIKETPPEHVADLARIIRAWQR